MENMDYLSDLIEILKSKEIKKHDIKEKIIGDIYNCSNAQEDEKIIADIGYNNPEIKEYIEKTDEYKDNHGERKIDVEAGDKTSYVANSVEYQVKRIRHKPYRGIFERISGKKSLTTMTTSSL